jgi:hypothetical protein
MTFPAAEASHISDESDSWYLTGKLTGQTTGKNYQFLTIFDKKKIVTRNGYMAQCSI